jgi:hypothetical protein
MVASRVKRTSAWIRARGPKSLGVLVPGGKQPGARTSRAAWRVRVIRSRGRPHGRDREITAHAHARARRRSATRTRERRPLARPVVSAARRTVVRRLSITSKVHVSQGVVGQSRSVNQIQS